MGQRGHGRRRLGSGGRLGSARSSRRCGAGEEPEPPAPRGRHRAGPRPPGRAAAHADGVRAGRVPPERSTAEESRSEAGRAGCSPRPMRRWAGASSPPHNEHLNSVRLREWLRVLERVHARVSKCIRKGGRRCNEKVIFLGIRAIKTSIVFVAIRSVAQLLRLSTASLMNTLQRAYQKPFRGQELSMQ